ncbi:MAG TPA: ABC transporter ATP-binding protein [Acidimicrobiales bacterium]|nr:ABC transporter ATP-binding protein [Acidimicrobiales bacterium]
MTSTGEVELGHPSHDGRLSNPALVVEHLSKRFGERFAFEDVSFEVGYGEVFGFLGPNGAGKTTSVRALGTLIAPSSGTAMVAGLSLTPENGQAIRKCISIMPESPGLYLRLTVAENLECFAGLYELPNAQERITNALRAVNSWTARTIPAAPSPRASANGSAWRGRCSTTRPSCSSTSQPRVSTLSPLARSTS